MKLRVLLILALAFSFASCNSPDKKKKNQPKPPKSIKDATGDVSYEGFVNRLRKAVEKHDLQMLASMMTPDFGYLMDATPSDSGAGEGVWKYWEANNLWPELNLVVHEKFVPFGNFMVAPPQFVTDPAYTGYRAGIMNMNGSWKFAYFVSGQQSANPPPPPQSPQ